MPKQQEININHKIKVTIPVDILMTITLFVLMSYQYIGGDRHEIAGAVMLVLLVLHHIRNISWYQHLVKGKYSAVRILQTVVDLALLIVMLTQMVSGIALSNKVFVFMELGLPVSIARNLHMICAYVGFLLMSIHIGLHYRMIINVIGKGFRSQEDNKIRTLILRVVAIAIAVYGVYALVKRDFFSYILLKNQFVFFDYQEPFFFFVLDYLTVMGLMIFIAYYLQKLCIRRSQLKDSKN